MFRKLGPLRVWSDFLADNRRRCQHIHGVTLTPCARVKDARGGVARPVYSLADISEFIRKVQAVEPTAGPRPIKPKNLALVPGRGWKVQKFDHNGAPIAWAQRAIGFPVPVHSLAH